MLTMLEEIVLLAVDEKTGCLRSVREYATAYALVGAVFFDLALAHKIDTDTETIHIIDTTPTGNATLDRVLADMARRTHLKTVEDWIEQLFYGRADLEGEALKSLIERGILRHQKSKLMWIIDVESYPMVNNKPQKFVTDRLASAILGDEIPDTRDIMLVSIAAPCGLLSYVLVEDALERRRRRIELLCHLETISRKVNAAIMSLDAARRNVIPRMI
jgi:golgi phosphoprotein 3